MNRQSTIVNFTIHSLILPKVKLNPFAIKWKFDKYFGITDHLFSDENKLLTVEKTFQLTTQFMLNSQNHFVEEKILKFNIYKCNKQKNEKFGKFQINLSKFIDSEYRQDIRIIFKNQDKDKMICILSVEIKKEETISIEGLNFQMSKIEEINNEIVDFTQIYLDFDLASSEHQTKIHDFLSKYKFHSPSSQKMITLESSIKTTESSSSKRI
jgi:hypothetical protein